MPKIFVIGIGYRPLDKRAHEALIRSRVVLASGRLADVFVRYAEYPEIKDKVVVINSIDETMSFMKSSLKADVDAEITLLASGDPMFFGIGRRVMQEFDRDTVELIPDLSSMQLAFARIKEPWDDALLLSLHGGPDPKRRRNLEYGLDDIPFLLKKKNRISVLTDRVNNPSVIAQTILNESEKAGLCISDIKMYVCEKIGYPEEKINQGSVADIAAGQFSDPNVVIILRAEEQKPGRTEELKCGSAEAQKLETTKFNEPSTSDFPDFRSSELIRFGLTENEIAHSQGLITKDEVRAAAIHSLRLPTYGVLWDIGAGSGSISIESAIMCPRLRVFAIEKNNNQLENILQNIDTFRLRNIQVVKGAAPDVLWDLPSPDRVFIGGSGGRIGEIIRFVGDQMQHGIIVVNAATLENLNLAVAALHDSQFSVEASQIAVSKMRPIGSGHFFSAQNPIFVITGCK